MYTAVLIEPRKHAAINFCLKNVLECLSDAWNIKIFHGTGNKEYITDILNTYKEEDQKRISLVDLNIDNLNLKTYSELLAKRSIIYDHIQTEYFLIFQTDSMLFKSHKDYITELISEDYDYIGSPWLITGYQPTRQRDFIGNGGLSLRKKSKMLEIIDKHNWDLTVPTEFEWMEDLYFTNCYSDVSIKKPPYEKAKQFSVDEVFSEISFGCHKPWVHRHYTEFVKIHPEVEELKSLQFTII
jgi:hypothetical protein